MVKMLKIIRLKLRCPTSSQMEELGKMVKVARMLQMVNLAKMAKVLKN